MSQVLLFDIDGTLIDSRGAGLAALQQGLLDAFQLHDRVSEMPELDLAGATDSVVVRDLFGAFGLVDTPDNRRLFYDAYLISLRKTLLERIQEPEPLPGVRQLLQDLTEHGGHVLGLLTGNIEPGARAKLSHYGLDHHFGFGAYGDDGEHRDELGPVALQRAAAFLGRDLDPSHCVVIGDTPRDIACARAAGMHCIAVATGSFSAEELATHEPDILLEELPSLEGFLTLAKTLAD